MDTIEEILKKYKIAKDRDLVKNMLRDFAHQIIEECADRAMVEVYCDYNRVDELEDFTRVNKDSILMLKEELE